MDTGINQAIKNGNGNALIMTAIFAAAIANSLPTPADAIYFKKQQAWKEKLELGEMSVKEYWWKDIAGYYFFTTCWYLGIGVVLLAAGNGDFNRSAKLLLLLAAGGLVVGVAQKNITKDEQLQELEKQQKAALAKKIGVPTCMLSTSPVAPAVCTTNFKTNS